MAEVINMPRLSDTMEEGVLVKWLKNIGDNVEEGDLLAEIETDKSVMEFEAFTEGKLLHIGIQEGETAAVDSLLAIIGEEGEDISALLSGGVAVAESPKTEAVKEEPKQEVTPSQPTENIETSAEVISMPRLSDTMEQGTLVKWFKKVGDSVEEGDILAEIETDKSVMEFESFYSGTLLHIGIQEGETADVDTVLAIVGNEGDPYEHLVNGVPVVTETQKETVAVTEVATEKKTETSSEESSSSDRIFASPLAKKIAADKGINLSEVKGSGDHGRIIKTDVENFTPSASSSTTKTSASVSSLASFSPIVAEEIQEEVKISQMRKVIAKRLAESKFTAPHYYLNVELDMDGVIQSRKKINEYAESKISFNDLIIKSVAAALKKHPAVNSSWNGDVITYNQNVHIGVAVAVEDGLLVPVIKNTDYKSLSQISKEVKELAGKAKERKLSPSEMEGSTFTISNLGMFGIESFTSIINQPNSAILSVGTIVQKPVVKNGEIVVGNTMKLSLACDHRTVDGATGAQFLLTLRQLIENPVSILV